LRLFRVGDYENLPLCLGFVGSRGSGKTAGAVATVCLDFLFRGLPAYSNVPIAVRVKYKDAEKLFQSEPLNKLNMLDLSEGYQNGVVLLDEVNMEAGDATRATSGANLALSYAVQQIRKRQLSLIWTCQGFMWVDNRLRWQLDYCIVCADTYLTKKDSAKYIGEKSTWRSHDLSGITGSYDFDYTLKHKWVSDFKVWQGDVYVRPWWFVYNTWELLGQEDYVAAYRENKALKASRTYELPEGWQLPEDVLASQLKEAGVVRIYASEIWKANDIENDRSARTKVGRAMKRAGYVRRRDSQGYYYELIEGGETDVNGL